MGYNFSNLSYADFEDLVRDLIGREEGIRFEAFGAGPDGGSDGRHAVGGISTILQAKHYVGSSFPTLKAAMKRERTSIDRLAPDRYILATSRPLTPPNKRELGSVIGAALKNESDIFNAMELNSLLRKYPDIERAHIKLWLSGSAVLDRVIRSALHSYTAISRAEVEAKVRVYAQNPSLEEARGKLEANHVVIISGPPGVGKTTLAEMLSYAYIAEDWEYVAIRNLDDGFAAIIDVRKQIFFFDDFLGRAGLDTRGLSAKDSDLAKFIRRIRTSPNARFILTTRSPIFEQARLASEHLADKRLDITKYALDVGKYTRRIKARILYNHLFVGGVPKDHVRALWDAGAIERIVDHRNFNPRIIETLTDTIGVRDLSPTAYKSAFLEALNKPSQIWDTAFRTHIPEKCRDLLFSLFFCSEYGVEIDELRLAFNALHSAISIKYCIPYDAKDFEQAVKILEGGFISIRGSNIDFVNPSLRDYLADYLDDIDQLCDFARVAKRASWAASLWKHVRTKRLAHFDEHEAIAKCFVDVARALVYLPIYKQIQREPLSLRICDICNAERISLLLAWWTASGDDHFSDCALSLARKPVDGFSSWRDGAKLAELIRDIRNESDVRYPCADELSRLLEDGLIKMLESGVRIDDLEKIYSAIKRGRNVINGNVFLAANQAIELEFENACANLPDSDSVSTLEDQMGAYQNLASEAGISSEQLDIVVTAIGSRISDIEEAVSKAEAPSFVANSLQKSEVFDDAALRNLFEPLTHE